MKTSTSKIFVGLIVLLLVMMSCNLPGSEEKVDLTSVAETVVLELTQRALGTNPVLGTEATSSVGTLTPSATFTETPVPSTTFTLTPTFTNTPLPCNKASFEGDITIPDGTEISSGTSFNKTWKIKNEGTCIWSSSYQIIFVDGNQMNAPAAVQLTPGSIAPGGSVEVTIQMKAPDAAGNYTGYYRIKAADGTIFGVGPTNASLSVVINSVSVATATFTLPPPPTPLFPDLYVSEFQINYGNPIDDDVPIHVRVGVYNKGTAAAGAFTVRFWGLETFTNHSCQWSVDSMSKGGGRILECDMQYVSLYADGLKAKVQVDVFGTVSESNEGNNIFLYPLNFVP